MSFEDLPIIQCKPGPTDAELQAQRDAQHAFDVAAFNDEKSAVEAWYDMRIFTGLDHLPPRAVEG